MSLTHFLFEASALKSRFSIFSATGRSCFEFVVALYFLTVFDFQWFSLIILATAFVLTGSSTLESFAAIFFAPGIRLFSKNSFFTCDVNSRRL